MSDALRLRRRLTAITCGPPHSPHLLAATTSSQVTAGPSWRRHLHAAGCSVTGTRPVQTSRNSLHHAASRSLTPPGQAIGYITTGNEFRVLINFLDSSFDFEKKSSLTSLVIDTDVHRNLPKNHRKLGNNYGTGFKVTVSV